MDDALALIVALKSTAVRVCGITSVSGNLPADRCYRNIHTVLNLMGVPESGEPQLPTGRGGPRALVRELAHDPFSHGADGLGETGLPPAAVPASRPMLPACSSSRPAGTRRTATRSPW